MAVLAALPSTSRRRSPRPRRVGAWLWRRRTLSAGVALIALMTILALAAPLLTPYSYHTMY
ncbi:MAG TPA: hypothetical protein VN837_04560, partial [Chloroflexota bacterium]|nr:hypothetical protein [Chloroflexota bacterium]